MDEYLFFQNHKGDLHKQGDSFLASSFQQGNEPNDKAISSKHDSLIKQLGE